MKFRLRGQRGTTKLYDVVREGTHEKLGEAERRPNGGGWTVRLPGHDAVEQPTSSRAWRYVNEVL